MYDGCSDDEGVPVAPGLHGVFAPVERRVGDDVHPVLHPSPGAISKPVSSVPLTRISWLSSPTSYTCISTYGSTGASVGTVNVTRLVLSPETSAHDTSSKFADGPRRCWSDRRASSRGVTHRSVGGLADKVQWR